MVTGLSVASPFALEKCTNPAPVLIKLLLTLFFPLFLQRFVGREIRYTLRNVDWLFMMPRALDTRSCVISLGLITGRA